MTSGEFPRGRVPDGDPPDTPGDMKAALDPRGVTVVGTWGGIQKHFAGTEIHKALAGKPDWKAKPYRFSSEVEFAKCLTDHMN